MAHPAEFRRDAVAVERPHEAPLFRIAGRLSPVAGGASWTRGSPLPVGGGNVSFVNANLGFLIGSPESPTLFRTTDAGVTWASGPSAPARRQVARDVPAHVLRSPGRDRTCRSHPRWARGGCLRYDDQRREDVVTRRATPSQGERSPVECRGPGSNTDHMVGVDRGAAFRVCHARCRSHLAQIAAALPPLCEPLRAGGPSCLAGQ